MRLHLAALALALPAAALAASLEDEISKDLLSTVDAVEASVGGAGFPDDLMGEDGDADADRPADAPDAFDAASFLAAQGGYMHPAALHTLGYYLHPHHVAVLHHHAAVAAAAAAAGQHALSYYWHGHAAAHAAALAHAAAHVHAAAVPFVHHPWPGMGLPLTVPLHGEHPGNGPAAAARAAAMLTDPSDASKPWQPTPIINTMEPSAVAVPKLKNNAPPLQAAFPQRFPGPFFQRAENPYSPWRIAPRDDDETAKEEGGQSVVAQQKETETVPEPAVVEMAENDALSGGSKDYESSKEISADVELTEKRIDDSEAAGMRSESPEATFSEQKMPEDKDEDETQSPSVSSDGAADESSAGLHEVKEDPIDLASKEAGMAEVAKDVASLEEANKPPTPSERKIEEQED